MHRRIQIQNNIFIYLNSNMQCLHYVDMLTAIIVIYYIINNVLTSINININKQVIQKQLVWIPYTTPTIYSIIHVSISTNKLYCLVHYDFSS